MRPLAIDLFCGLGGWADGLLVEGYDIIGFDIERHVYGECRYPAQLVIQDVLTLHGSQFRDAVLIVASPPCQEYSYMAMPWSLAKAKAAVILADESGKKLEELNRLFHACFRIQREACEAAGQHVPMIVENVRGAQPWIGRARWNFGSFYLWGDVPALMPSARGAKVPGVRFDGSGSFQTASVNEAYKSSGMNWSDRSKSGQDFTRIAGIKGVLHRTAGHWTNPIEHEGRRNSNDWHGSGDNCSLQRQCGSKSMGRKAASAMIAKIPLPLSRHIGAAFR